MLYNTPVIIGGVRVSKEYIDLEEAKEVIEAFIKAADLDIEIVYKKP